MSVRGLFLLIAFLFSTLLFVLEVAQVGLAAQWPWWVVPLPLIAVVGLYGVVDFADAREQRLRRQRAAEFDRQHQILTQIGGRKGH